MIRSSFLLLSFCTAFVEPYDISRSPCQCLQITWNKNRSGSDFLLRSSFELAPRLNTISVWPYLGYEVIPSDVAHDMNDSGTLFPIRKRMS
jgi:hypothetical protein